MSDLQRTMEVMKVLIDQLLPSPIFFIFFMAIPAIAIGLRLGGYFIKLFNESLVAPVETFDSLPFLGGEKPKRDSVSFFEQSDEQPDYVVGFGDDGELIYASEKPKHKNDEV